MQNYSTSPFKIEDFITHRITEMNQFYKQMNLQQPLQQNLDLLKTFQKPSNLTSSICQQQEPQQLFFKNSPQNIENFQFFEEYHPQKILNTEPPTILLEKPDNENRFQRKQSQDQKRINFDDMPVKGRGRKFEDILQEQLISQTADEMSKLEIPKRVNYLKKQSRKFQSHTQNKKDQTQIKDQQCELAQCFESPNLSTGSIRTSHERIQKSPNQSPKSIKQQIMSKERVIKQKLKRNPQTQSSNHNSNNELNEQNEQKQQNELKLQLEGEFSKQKFVTQQLKSKQKKLDSQLNMLMIERDQLNQDQEKFASEKKNIIQDEKKKFKKELKSQEKNIKVQIEGKLLRDREDIKAVKQKVQTYQAFNQTSENKYLLQINKLKQQNDHLMVQKSEQKNHFETKLQQLGQQLLSYQIQIKQLHEEILRLQESHTQVSQESKTSEYPRQDIITQDKYQQISDRSRLDRAQNSQERYQSKYAKEHAKSAHIKNTSKSQEFHQSKSARIPKTQSNYSQKLDLTQLSDQTITAIDLGTKIDEAQFVYNQNSRYIQYLKEKAIKSIVVNKTVDSDGKVNLHYKNGKKEVQFSSGISKEIFKDGYIVVNFKNKDLKQVFSNGIIVYYFEDADATQTTLLNGQNIYKFQNKQIEIHHPNGQKEIKYEDGTLKIFEEGVEEVVLSNDDTETQQGCRLASSIS